MKGGESSREIIQHSALNRFHHISPSLLVSISIRNQFESHEITSEHLFWCFIDLHFLWYLLKNRNLHSFQWASHSVRFLFYWQYIRSLFFFLIFHRCCIKSLFVFHEHWMNNTFGMIFLHLHVFSAAKEKNGAEKFMQILWNCCRR